MVATASLIESLMEKYVKMRSDEQMEEKFDSIGQQSHWHWPSQRYAL